MKVRINKEGPPEKLTLLECTKEEGVYIPVNEDGTESSEFRIITLLGTNGCYTLLYLGLRTGSLEPADVETWGSHHFRRLKTRFSITFN